MGKSPLTQTGVYSVCPPATGGIVANQPTTETSIEEQLRIEADRRLKNGNPPPSQVWAISPEALSLLYRLASDPDSAADALKLLHELQAHQVELDLQHEHIKDNERELAQDLDHYRTLFECAPVGYFMVDFDGRIMETNRVGAGLLGMDESNARGRPLEGFLDADSRPTLNEFLRALRDGGSNAVCKVRSGNRDDDPRTLRIAADTAPGGEAVLLVVSEAD